ncbi:MAG: hypothetical protein ACR2MN_13665 [Acidimicrobiales bacterium]
MSMTAPVSQGVIDGADRIREDADNSYQRVRAMRELNDAAIRQRLAVIYMAAKATMATLEESASGNYQRSWQQAVTAAFGVADLASNPGEKAMVSMSYRESLDRLDQLDDYTEGARLLDRANDTGDELLARAAGLRAWTMGGQLGGSGWGDVLATFLASRPKASAAVAVLASLQGGSANIRDMFAFILPIPPELGSLPEYQIAALAAS